MSRDTQHVLLGLLGGALIKLAFGGGFLAYVRPGHQPWLLGAGVVMVALAIAGVARDLRAREAGHGHGFAPWLMILPVLAILLVPPAALGADAAGRVDGNAVAARAASFDPLPPGPAPPLRMTEVVGRAIEDRSGSLDGRQVTLTGFVVRHGAELRLARLTITCCAADARPMSVRLVGGGLDSPAAPPDTWLRVRGEIDPGSANPSTRYVPTFQVTDAAVIPAPEDPYEY